MLGRYLKILDESLDKKLALLKEIEDLSLSQSVMIEDGAAFEDIDANMDDKAALIDRINKLDEGFQAMYDNIKENLEAQKEEYEDEIELIKKKISEVMSCSTQIQAIEARNKAAMEQRFAKAHNNIIRVQRIIEEFRNTLDRKYPVAEDFDRIYVYLLKRLYEANVKKDKEIMEEVLTHLRSMRDTWIQVMKANKVRGVV